MIRSRIIEALLLASLLAPATARADDVEEARRRFTLGEEQYARGSYEEAYASYEAAYRAAPLSDFLFNMGQCQRKLGNAAEALALYQRFLDTNPPADRRAVVEGILRDMAVTLPAEDSAGRAPAAGAHARQGPRPGDRARRQTGGDVPERPAFFARLRAPTWIVATGALVLGGVGGLAALGAQSGQDELDQLDCTRGIRRCQAAADDARGWFLARDVTLAAGGLALGVAIVLAIVDAGATPLEQDVAIAPTLDPRVAGVSVRGRF